MLNGTGNYRIRHSRKRARSIILAIRQTRGKRVEGSVAGLEAAAGFVEGAELDGDAGADADEGREGAFVEGEGAFGSVDCAGCC
jgi:hypothetical protein